MKSLNKGKLAIIVAVFSATIVYWARLLKIRHFALEQGSYQYQFYSAIQYIWETGHEPERGAVRVSDYTHGFYLGQQDPIKNIYPALELQIYGLDSLEGFFLMGQYGQYRSLIVFPILIMGIYHFYARSVGRSTTLSSYVMLYLASIAVNWVFLQLGAEWSAQDNIFLDFTYILLAFLGLTFGRYDKRHYIISLFGAPLLLLQHRTGAIYLLSVLCLLLALPVLARILRNRLTGHKTLWTLIPVRPLSRTEVPLGGLTMLVVIFGYYLYQAPEFARLGASVAIAITRGQPLLVGGENSNYIQSILWEAPGRPLWGASVALSLLLCIGLAYAWTVLDLSQDTPHDVLHDHLGKLITLVGGVGLFTVLFIAFGGVSKAAFRTAEYGGLAALVLGAFLYAVQPGRLERHHLHVALIGIVLVSLLAWTVTDPPTRGRMHEDEAQGVETIGTHVDDDAVIFSDLRVGTLFTAYGNFRITGAIHLQGLRTGEGIEETLRALYYDRPSQAEETIYNHKTSNGNSVDYVVLSKRYSEYGVLGTMFRVQAPDEGYLDRYDRSNGVQKIYENGNLNGYKAKNTSATK